MVICITQKKIQWSNEKDWAGYGQFLCCRTFQSL